MKKRRIIFAIAVIAVLSAVGALLLAVRPNRPQLSNTARVEDIVSHRYNLEQALLMEAIFNVRDGFEAVDAQALADEVGVKLECKRQLSPELYYYVWIADGYRCFVYADPDDVVQKVMVTYKFATINEVKALVKDAELYGRSTPINESEVYCMNSVADICCTGAGAYDFFIPLQDGVAIMERPSLASGKDPVYYYYTNEEWPAANAAWKDERPAWNCKYQVLPIDLKW